MKKYYRTVIFIAALFLTLGFCVNGVETKVEAAAIKNVMRAPKAKPGTWVRCPKGFRYRYNYNGEFARKALLNVNGKIFYFRSSGYLYTGWKTYRGKHYYFNPRGRLYIGWKTVGKKKYYFRPKDGALAVGPTKIDGQYYYFSNKGVMQTGWQNIGKYYYYLDPVTGARVTNRKVGDYVLDRKGRRTTGDGTVMEKRGQVDIFVGDSRTLGMCSTVHGSGCGKCIAKSGEGYNYFVNTVLGQLRYRLNQNPEAVVVINMGVNDNHNRSKYIAKYRELITAYPKAQIYFLSVNPIDRKYHGYYYTYESLSSGINAFNDELRKAFPARYIDCSSYLIENGFATVDGLHYTSDTYRRIYEYILSKV